MQMSSPQRLPAVVEFRQEVIHRWRQAVAALLVSLEVALLAKRTGGAGQKTLELGLEQAVRLALLLRGLGDTA
jgi:hypothetical protein